MLTRIQRLLFDYFVDELLVLGLFICPSVPLDLLIEGTSGSATFLLSYDEVGAFVAVDQWVLANIRQNLFSGVFFLLPGLDIVIGLLLLQPLKNHLVFPGDFDELTLSRFPVQALPLHHRGPWLQS